MREVVVDAAAERVELRELEHCAGVGGDERVDALDVEERLERLRRVVDVRGHRLGHLDLAVDVFGVVELERLRHVERARLQLRDELLLEREHHDHLERVAVPLVGVFVLEPQQVRDLRPEVGLRVAARGARVLLVEALERGFVVRERVRVFVEQQRERLVGALVGAELLRDEVEQVEVLGHVDQLVLDAVDQAPVRDLRLRLLLRVLEERLQLGLVDLAFEQRAELLLRLELELREVAQVAGLRLAAAHLVDHVLDALDLLVALVVDRLLEDRALVFERDEFGVERRVFGLQRLVLGGRAVVQLALLHELAVELRQFLAGRRVLLALVGDLLRDRVDLALHFVHVVLLGFVHDLLLDALADRALVPAFEVSLVLAAAPERRLLFGGADLFWLRLRLQERLLVRREAGAAAWLRLCVRADELVHLVFELLDELALLLDVFVFLLDVFFHFAQLVFVEVAGVLALLGFELARLLFVERAELVERELHVFHGGLVGVVADLEVGQLLVLDLHHVLEGFEVLRGVARVRLAVELDLAEVLERAQLAAFLLVELHLQRADLLGVEDLEFLDLLAEVRALLLLGFEFGVLLVDDLLERADGLVGLARLVRELLLDGLLEVEVEAVELAPERGVRVGVLGALDLLLLLEQVREVADFDFLRGVLLLERAVGSFELDVLVLDQHDAVEAERGRVAAVRLRLVEVQRLVELAARLPGVLQRLRLAEAREAELRVRLLQRVVEAERRVAQLLQRAVELLVLAAQLVFLLEALGLEFDVVLLERAYALEQLLLDLVHLLDLLAHVGLGALGLHDPEFGLAQLLAELDVALDFLGRVVFERGERLVGVPCFFLRDLALDLQLAEFVLERHALAAGRLALALDGHEEVLELVVLLERELAARDEVVCVAQLVVLGGEVREAHVGLEFVLGLRVERLLEVHVRELDQVALLHGLDLLLLVVDRLQLVDLQLVRDLRELDLAVVFGGGVAENRVEDLELLRVGVLDLGEGLDLAREHEDHVLVVVALGAQLGDLARELVVAGRQLLALGHRDAAGELLLVVLEFELQVAVLLVQLGHGGDLVLVQLLHLGREVLALADLGLGDGEHLCELVDLLGEACLVDLRLVERVGLEVDGEERALVERAERLFVLVEDADVLAALDEGVHGDGLGLLAARVEAGEEVAQFGLVLVLAVLEQVFVQQVDGQQARVVAAGAHHLLETRVLVEEREDLLHLLRDPVAQVEVLEGGHLLDAQHAQLRNEVVLVDGVQRREVHLAQDVVRDLGGHLAVQREQELAELLLADAARLVAVDLGEQLLERHLLLVELGLDLEQDALVAVEVAQALLPEARLQRAHRRLVALVREDLEEQLDVLVAQVDLLAPEDLLEVLRAQVGPRVLVLAEQVGERDFVLLQHFDDLAHAGQLEALGGVVERQACGEHGQLAFDLEDVADDLVVALAVVVEPVLHFAHDHEVLLLGRVLRNQVGLARLPALQVVLHAVLGVGGHRELEPRLQLLQRHVGVGLPLLQLRDLLHEVLLALLDVLEHLGVVLLVQLALVLEHVEQPLVLDLVRLEDADAFEQLEILGLLCALAGFAVEFVEAALHLLDLAVELRARVLDLRVEESDLVVLAQQVVLGLEEVADEHVLDHHAFLQVARDLGHALVGQLLVLAQADARVDRVEQQRVHGLLLDLLVLLRQRGEAADRDELVDLGHKVAVGFVVEVERDVRDHGVARELVHAALVAARALRLAVALPVPAPAVRVVAVGLRACAAERAALVLDDRVVVDRVHRAVEVVVEFHREFVVEVLDLVLERVRDLVERGRVERLAGAARVLVHELVEFVDDVVEVLLHVHVFEEVELLLEVRDFLFVELGLVAVGLVLDALAQVLGVLVDEHHLLRVEVELGALAGVALVLVHEFGVEFLVLALEHDVGGLEHLHVLAQLLELALLARAGLPLVHPPVLRQPRLLLQDADFGFVVDLLAVEVADFLLVLGEVAAQLLQAAREFLVGVDELGHLAALVLVLELLAELVGALQVLAELLVPVVERLDLLLVALQLLAQVLDDGVGLRRVFHRLVVADRFPQFFCDLVLLSVFDEQGLVREFVALQLPVDILVLFHQLIVHGVQLADFLPHFI